jgi:galactoside O-acetyltransferase
MIGFKSLGSNVKISRKASIYGAENMEIGSNVRIDDFCFLSGKLRFDGYNHVATGCYLYGSREGIVFEQFAGIAPRVTIHADSDDYSGEWMTNPTVPEEFKNVEHGQVVLKRHVIIGSASVVLPGVVIEEGCAIGAMSMVYKSTTPWTISVGIPCRETKSRSRKLLELESRMLESLNNVMIGDM